MDGGADGARLGVAFAPVAQRRDKGRSRPGVGVGAGHFGSWVIWAGHSDLTELLASVDAQGETMTVEELAAALRAFARARDWGQFHTPKNLAMALAGEAGEVLAELQWLTPEEAESLSDGQRESLAMELADVMIYLVRLADVTGIDLMDAAERKLSINENRFPLSQRTGA